MMPRTVDFRFRILRNGADFGELSRAPGSAPSISMNEADSVKTCLSGTFLQPTAPVDWLTDSIRPELVIDGITHTLGVYLPVNVSENDNGTTKTVAITADDRCWVVRDSKTESRIFLPAGTNYVEAVTSLISRTGIAQINATATAETLSEDREDWEIGTSYLDIVNELLNEINYAPLWFDQDGVAVIKPLSTPTAVNIDHILDAEDIRNRVLPGIQSQTDINSAPNVFVCVCSNADKSAPMRAVAENTNPQSPLSIARRGRKITKLIQVNNIASQEALQAYANRQVTESLLSGEVITLRTRLLPGFGVGDVTAIRYGDRMDICKESAWSMQLDVNGQMTHTLERTVMSLG